MISHLSQIYRPMISHLSQIYRPISYLSQIYRPMISHLSQINNITPQSDIQTNNITPQSDIQTNDITPQSDIQTNDITPQSDIHTNNITPQIYRPIVSYLSPIQRPIISHLSQILKPHDIRVCTAGQNSSAFPCHINVFLILVPELRPGRYASESQRMSVNFISVVRMEMEKDPTPSCAGVGITVIFLYMGIYVQVSDLAPSCVHARPCMDPRMHRHRCTHSGPQSVSDQRMLLRIKINSAKMAMFARCWHICVNSLLVCVCVCACAHVHMRACEKERECVCVGVCACIKTVQIFSASTDLHLMKNLYSMRMLRMKKKMPSMKRANRLRPTIFHSKMSYTSFSPGHASSTYQRLASFFFFFPPPPRKY